MDIQNVRRSLYFRPVLDGGRLGLPGTVLFRWCSAFPFAVRLFFPATEVTRARAVEVNRQVLAEGIDFESSDSGVTVRRLKSGQMEISLNDGSLRVLVSRKALIDALSETLALVDLGCEFDEFDVDLWLSTELPEVA